MSDDMTDMTIREALEDLGRSFEAFKATHDEAALEQKMRGYADRLVEDRLERIGNEIGRLQSRVERIGLAHARTPLAETKAKEADGEHKAAFLEGYLRKGLERDVARHETKALTAGTPSEGGYAVPLEIDHAIESRLRDLSPIRAIAGIATIGGANYRKLVSVGAPASGWVGETDPRLGTGAPVFAEVAPPLGEIYANPAATQAMLDDAFFDVESWLAEELANEFARKEGAAFVAGDGIDKPRGFLAGSSSALLDDNRPFGTLQYVATGTAGAFPSGNPADVLFDLIHSLKSGYRAGARFVMNSTTLNIVRKFKDADGNYLWRPGLSEGQPASLLGYPVVEAEDMPDIGADTNAIAFGNFARGYLITDRMGTRVLRDPYSNKPFVHFYTTRRVGGAVVNSDAIKLLRFSLS